MFNRFDHYLSYGSTDQETVRELSSSFSGLLVPGTIAAFQSEGTRGFVLSLSAKSQEPYAIDTRFPLFQNQLKKSKRSHLMLAKILGFSSLVNADRLPVPSDVTLEMAKKISENWIDFNEKFDDVKTKTFEKYSARLKVQVLPSDGKKPTYILPPYAMVGSREDGWWDLSKDFWKFATEYATSKGVNEKLRRVIAAKDPKVWSTLAAEVSDREIVGWVSNLDEFDYRSEEMLKDYGVALMAARERDQKVFALYGGFFSVLLSNYGLTGASHGIGFGEHRDSIELPSSGAPPARYYVPRLHRYVSVEIAVYLWRQFPTLISCDCIDCLNGSPAALNYHGLMRHSVRVRQNEIRDWVDAPVADIIAHLKSNFAEFRSAVPKLNAPEKVVDGARTIYPHLAMWARVIEGLS